ncbi:MAG: 16S rRNA (cytidine(1402)-2'-O)-methyltransferase [Tissierellia bacterium]|nr:16S rRNA (cytidine(1402)-2'-O)-methyltransferase [Tissierellia bacterium]
MNDRGILYILPTPIGNLEDISFRILDVLRDVDIVLCEDTRHTVKILNHFQIEAKLISYHEHNEKKRADDVLKWINEGRDIALVSDAGMPCISDPGSILVDLAHLNGVEITVLPGPNAAVTAIAASGFDSSRFQFIGFLPRNKGKKKAELLETGEYKGLTIIYESPHRFLDTISDIMTLFPKREIFVARELTKIHEEYYRSEVEEVYDYFKDRNIRGEFVLVLNKYETHELIDIESELRNLISMGYSKSKAVKELASKHDISKNEIYEISLKI